MPAVIATQIIVPAKTVVIVAGLPIATGIDAMQQSAVMQHRQIKALAVPGHDGRGIFLNAAVETFHQIFFSGLQIAQRPHGKAIARTQSDRDGDDALHMQAQEVGTAFLPAFVKQDTADFLVA